jgi:Tol biopolymer transport system component
MGIRACLSAVGAMLCLLMLATASQAARTEVVSVNSAGVEGNQATEEAAISADGRFVAFASLASNLVPGDTNGTWDVFVYDRVTGGTERVSVGIYAQANGASRSPAISADGRYVAFASVATNLVLGDSNMSEDVFVRDRAYALTTRVSVGNLGSEADAPSGEPSVSDDGRFVAFSSLADNLVLGDVNMRQDVFLRDLRVGTTIPVSVTDFNQGANGASGQPAISGNGEFVAFASLASNLVSGDVNVLQDVFVRDLVTQRTEIVSISTGNVLGNGVSALPSISEDGRYVAFESFADDLVPNDFDLSEDIFVRDRLFGTTEAATPVGPCDGVPCGASFEASISRDGRFVSYASLASDLVPDDTNGVADVFVTDRVLERIMRMSIASDGAQGNENSYLPAITGDGHAVAFIDIESTVMAGIVTGFPDGLFRPHLPVTRAQMAVFLARAIAGGDALVPPGPSEPTFSDVPTDFWAYRYIEFIAERGIAEGFPDGAFQPGLEVTRAQMAVFLARVVAGSDAAVPPGPSQPTFSDVPTDYWAYRYIEFVAEQGIAEGYPDGTYRPDVVVARDQMAVFLARTFDLPALAFQ